MEQSNMPASTSQKRKRNAKRRLEFIGWGSRPLIEFLQSIGKNTDGEIPRFDVAVLVNRYIKEQGLVSTQPKKKNKVICDDKLYALFGKKSVKRRNIYELLEAHFTQNNNDSEDGDHHQEENASTPTLDEVVMDRGNFFAAVVPENVKLVYLKRSLVEELLEAPESFEQKVVGSFVRVRTDPYNIYQRNEFQLQLVTGVEKASGSDTDINLKISDHVEGVPIRKLSDSNFTEEEVVDLQDRIKAGMLHRATVNELEAKAKILHAHITKHSIGKELLMLENKINHANEKGWRRELFECYDRRKQLKSPYEVEKMLQDIPKVIAEEPEPQETEASPLEIAVPSSPHPNPISGRSSNICKTDASGSHCESSMCVKNNSTAERSIRVGEGAKMDPECMGTEKNKHHEQPMLQASVEGEGASTDVHRNSYKSFWERDDFPIWHYFDPLGRTQGPYSLTVLKQWKGIAFFKPDLRIWRTGQSPVDGVLLADVLHRAFPE